VSSFVYFAVSSDFDERISEPFVVVEDVTEKGCNYRVENVSSVDTDSTDPQFELRYMVDDTVYGSVVVYLLPECRRKYAVPPLKPIIPATPAPNTPPRTTTDDWLDKDRRRVAEVTDLSMITIDDADSWLGFGPERVAGMIDDAMVYSLENDCRTEIRWDVREE
jgi:hypothetical protein